MKELDSLFNTKTTSGKIIKSFRVTLNITQKEMSEAIDISPTNLSAIENDKRDIGVEIATRIGAFLGINPSILLFPNGQQAAILKHRDIVKKAERIKSKKAV